MDTRPAFASRTRLAPPSRRPAWIAAAIGALIAIALVKPWGAPTPRPSPPADVAADVAAASPVTPASSAATLAEPTPPVADAPLQPGEIACQPAGWRLAWTGRMAGWAVETWQVAAPVAATGPLDPSIPTADLGYDAIVGLGACAPPDPAVGGPRPSRIVHAWRLTAPPGPAAVEIGLVAVGPVGKAPIVPLARPARTPGGVWPPGSYVIEIAVPAAAPSSPSEAVWLRIDVGGPAPRT